MMIVVMLLIEEAQSWRMTIEVNKAKQSVKVFNYPNV
jgi:hypothetical protein